MGDPRRFRKNYENPKKLWEKDRIKHDKTLKVGYGLKSMRELWVITAKLKKYRREARRLLSLTEEERKDDVEKILARLAKMGVMKEGSKLDDILSLEVKEFLERRLQTLVQRKGLARTMRQARQLITHGFISVNNRRVSAPSYLVPVKQEDSIMYSKPIDISIRDSGDDEEKPDGSSSTEGAPSEKATA